MIGIRDLPTLNAVLNTLSAVFLGAGYRFIRQGRKTEHRACMLAAGVTSVLFLVSYVTYHAATGSTRFRSEGWIRTVYLGILLTHTVLAAVIVPLVLATFYQALRGRFTAHRRVARWTWPVWMYVSVTGVVVYLLLYHLDPWLLGRGGG